MVAHRIRRTLLALAAPVLVAGLLAGCQDISDFAGARAMSPVSASLKKKIAAGGMDVRSPIMLRIFKEEAVLEVWKEDRSGRMRLLEDYKICAWSGKLGPKVKEGDRQAPEGFYTVTPAQMNPNSSYYLSFNIGFPNAFDRSLNRTGSNIMVHGDCSSRGCYSMTDEQVEEIYVLAREAFAGGQRGFQVQAFPFRMTAENLARHADSEHFEFWKMLKDGSDHFEVSQKTPKVAVCGKKYVFDATPSTGSFRPTEPCPGFTVDAEIERLVAERRQADDAKIATLVADARDKAERDKRWAEREKALATMFRAGQGDAEKAAEAAATGETAIAAAPAPAPAADGGKAPAAKPAPEAKPVAVAATPAAAPTPTAAPAAVASIAAPAAAAPAPEAKVAAETTTAPAAAPLGYAAEPLPDDSDAGFFDAVTKRSQGLFRRAGDLFN